MHRQHAARALAQLWRSKAERGVVGFGQKFFTEAAMAAKKTKRVIHRITNGPSHRKAFALASDLPIAFEWGEGRELDGTHERFEFRASPDGIGVSHLALLLRLSKDIVFRNGGKRVVSFAWVHFARDGRPEYWEEASELDLI